MPAVPGKTNDPDNEQTSRTCRQQAQEQVVSETVLRSRVRRLDAPQRKPCANHDRGGNCQGQRKLPYHLRRAQLSEHYQYAPLASCIEYIASQRPQKVHAQRQPLRAGADLRLTDPRHFIPIGCGGGEQSAISERLVVIYFEPGPADLKFLARTKQF